MAQMTIEKAFELALQIHQGGRLAEAEKIYRQVLAAQPANAGALHYLGVIAHQQGQHATAAELIRKSLAILPNYPEALDNLGNALNALGLRNEAIAAYRRAAVLMPHSAQTRNNRGIALLADEQVDEAIIAYREAIAIDPGFAEAHSNLSSALWRKSELEEALIEARTAIALDPGNAKAYGNLGNALRDTGQFEESIAAYRKIISLEPANPDAHLNLSIALLTLGSFAEGLKEYEWRLECQGYASMRRNFAQPRWDGRPLEGQTLLLHAEQGFGDTIQFIRYVPLVARRVRTIVVECQPELQRLLASLSGGCQLVPRGRALPHFDVESPLPSLPLALGTTLKTLPADVPYLTANPELIESWRKKLERYGSGLKVALAWAGNPQHKNDRVRSIPLDVLAPLGNIRGVNFFSLQKGDAERQADHPPVNLHLVNLAPELNDFADTAAVMSLMDLVIVPDTAVAHLAGALRRPVWVMLPFVSDSRWLTGRTDSPWYPSMRLFRQAVRGDWTSLIEGVAATLSDLVGTGQSREVSPRR